MSKHTRKPQAKTEERRTTIYVAAATFAGLSMLSLVAWALIRAKTPVIAPSAAASVAPVGPPARPGLERMSIEDFKTAYDRKEITVLDVRPIEAFLVSHIPGAMHIPVSRVQGEIAYLPKDKPIVAYCSCPAEESSGEAVLILANGGIKAFALTGGLEAWTRAGYPTVAGVK